MYIIKELDIEGNFEILDIKNENIEELKKDLVKYIKRKIIKLGVDKYVGGLDDSINGGFIYSRTETEEGSSIVQYLKYEILEEI